VRRVHVAFQLSHQLLERRGAKLTKDLAVALGKSLASNIQGKTRGEAVVVVKTGIVVAK